MSLLCLEIIRNQEEDKERIVVLSFNSFLRRKREKITSHLLSMDFNSAAFLLDIDGVMLLFWTLEYRCWFEDSDVWKEFWLKVPICFMDRRKVYSSLGFQDRCEENNFHLQWSHQKLKSPAHLSTSVGWKTPNSGSQVPRNF